MTSHTTLEYGPSTGAAGRRSESYPPPRRVSSKRFEGIDARRNTLAPLVGQLARFAPLSSNFTRFFPSPRRRSPPRARPNPPRLDQRGQRRDSAEKTLSRRPDLRKAPPLHVFSLHAPRLDLHWQRRRVNQSVQESQHLRR